MKIHISFFISLHPQSHTTEKLKLWINHSNIQTWSNFILFSTLTFRADHLLLNFSSMSKTQTILHICHMAYLGTKNNKKKIKQFCHFSFFLVLLIFACCCCCYSVGKQRNEWSFTKTTESILWPWFLSRFWEICLL